MKKVLVINYLMTMIVTSALADVGKIFVGHSFWEKPGYSETFSPLEQLGVLKSAEQNASSNCLRGGFRDCRVLESHITECNGWNGQNTCEASSTAVGN